VRVLLGLDRLVYTPLLHGLRRSAPVVAHHQSRRGALPTMPPASFAHLVGAPSVPEDRSVQSSMRSSARTSMTARAGGAHACSEDVLLVHRSSCQCAASASAACAQFSRRGARSAPWPAMEPALRRIQATPSQTDLRPHAATPTCAARSCPPRDRRARPVRCLVDDEHDGATLEACARVLRDAGAREVRAVTAARVVSRPR
jgi:hypothetical protein